MTRILEVEVPSEHQDVLPADARISFEAKVPHDSRSTAYVWYHDEDPEPIASSLVDRGVVDAVDIVESYPNDWLAHIEWSRDLWPFNACVREFNGAILSNEFANGRWKVRLRFPDAEAVSGFNSQCLERGVSLDINRIVEPDTPATPGDIGITAKQREALELALEHGYFGVPRQVSTSELAGIIGISDQALIERLRRGLNTILEQSLHR